MMTHISKDDITLSHQFETDSVVSVTTEDHHTYGVTTSRLNCYIKFRQHRNLMYSWYWNVYGEYDYEGRSELHDIDGIEFFSRKPTINDALGYLVDYINIHLEDNDA